MHTNELLIYFVFITAAPWLVFALLHLRSILRELRRTEWDTRKWWIE